MNHPGRNDPCPCGSGKKYKQCCGNAAPGASLAAPPLAAQIGMALQAALAHHHAGKLAEAETIYRRVLGADPNNFDALHLLGMLHHQSGRHEQAVQWMERAIRIDGNDAPALNNLGEAYRALGALDQAGDSFEQALRLAPSYAEARHNLGLVRWTQGRIVDAINCMQDALATKPDYAKAWRNLGTLYQAASRAADAQAAWERALALQPDLHEALHGLALLHKDLGNIKKAVLAIQRALKLQPGEDAYWRAFAECIKLLSTEAVDIVDSTMLLQAFSRADIDPQQLEPIATASILRAAALQDLLASAPSPDQPLALHELQALYGSPLLAAVLEHTLVTDYRLEQVLTAARASLLTASVSDKPAIPAPIKSVACLASQCFANEYIYQQSDTETRQVSALADHLSQCVAQGGTGVIERILVLACYLPLHRLPFAAQLSMLASDVPEVQTVLRRQLAEPAEEDRIKATLPHFTPIDDGISKAVRAQYEENPYPRWHRRGKPGKGLSVHQALRARLPHQDIADTSLEKPAILIAGCGTGSDASQIAKSFANADILAVDISRTSLAYAQRATRAAGIDNIEFGQADILELGRLDRQFDLIVSSGVLHHMREPMAGWRVLTGLLRAGGYMNIGLYSRRARHEVTRARQLVKDAGYPATLDGIRHFRRDVMAKDAPIDIGSLAHSPDFFSVSACRDLIFHVQEHVYDPLEIQACIDELGLRFLGFEFASPLPRQLYLERFPDNPAADILANWDLIEQQHPQIFAGMYQFWLHKPA